MVEYYEKEGFFTTERIAELGEKLEGFHAEHYHFRLTKKIGLMLEGTGIIGYADRMSFGIVREAAPIYTIGSVSPRSFSRTRRSVGGTILADRALLTRLYTLNSKLSNIRAVYEESIGDDTYQIIISGIEILDNGVSPILESIMDNETNQWNFVATTVSTSRIPRTNAGFAKKLLKPKEWIPVCP